VKASGVLGWLGVKKTVKRRPSETKLQTLDAGKAETQIPSRPHSPSVVSLGSFDRGASKESLHEMSSRPEVPRLQRPEITLQSSSKTIVVPGNNTQPRSIFRGRSSSRGPSSRGPSPTSRSVDARPAPITINPARHSTASSSRSSLRSSHADPVSPGLLSSVQWATSPTDGEETLFGPESGSNWGPGVRPWMDGTEAHRSARSSLSTSNPLGSLPEQGVPVVSAPVAATSDGSQVGRLRSWSDAPLPPQPMVRGRTDSNPHSGSNSLASNSFQDTSARPVRPKLPGRSSSGNSALIGKVRSVFAKTTSRGRSQTLLRQRSSDVDEFGSVRSGDEWSHGSMIRPTSSFSDVSSVRRPGSGVITAENSQTLLDLSEADRHVLSLETPDRSPRTSIAAASISSVQSASTRQSGKLDAPQGRTGRARASTMFSKPPSSFGRPPSPLVVPAAATPPRRRPSVIQRLSSGVLRSGQSSPRGSLFPLPPRSSGSLSSSVPTPWGPEETPSSLASPRPSAGSVTAAMGTSSLKALAAREEGDTPDIWLERVVGRIGRNDIANVLASRYVFCVSIRPTLIS
jgi:hypothetical protein